MFKTVLRFAPLVLLVPVLTACGGGSGGGGSDPVIPFTSFDDLPETGTVELAGQARTARYSVDQATGQITLTNVSGPDDSTLRITAQNGTLPVLAIRAPESSVSFDLRTGSTVEVFSELFVFESNDGDRFALIVDTGPNGAFEHQIFGTWADGFAGDRGTVGAGAYGARTPAAGIPVGTTAAYDGVGLGYARLADGRDYQTVTMIEVSTDFAQAWMSSTDTTTISLSGGGTAAAPELDFEGGGPVSGSGFTATVSGPASAGQAEGTFHGPTAGEVAGTYELTGAGGLTHIGAFGGN